MFGAIFHQILAVIPVGFNEFNKGIGYGWISPTLNRFHEEGLYSLQDIAWLGSIHEFGRIIGPLIAAIFLDRIGRKKICILCSFMFFISWILIIFGSSMIYIFFGRLIFGLGAGMHDVTSSIYLGENCSPDVRGAFYNIITTCFCGAEFVQFIIATIFPYDQTLVINFTLTTVALITIFLLVETPQYLLTKNQHDEALRNFIYLNGLERSCEFEKMKQNIEEQESKNKIKDFIDPVNYKSLLIVFMLYMFSMGTGYGVVTSYIGFLMPSGELTSQQFTVLFGFIQLLSTICATFYIDQFNRRTIVLLCFLKISFVQMITAGLLFVQGSVGSSLNFSWWIFISVSAYGALYPVMYSMVNLIRGEILPQSVKAIGGFMGVAIYSIVAFVTTRLFLVVAEMYGSYVNFLFFGLVGFLSTMFNYYVLPETRGMNLVDIYDLLKALRNSKV